VNADVRELVADAERALRERDLRAGRRALDAHPTWPQVVLDELGDWS
jgi:hypothetical protein